MTRDFQKHKDSTGKLRYYLSNFFDDSSVPGENSIFNNTFLKTTPYNKSSIA
jgi:hypothetical protein